MAFGFAACTGEATTTGDELDELPGGDFPGDHPGAGSETGSLEGEDLPLSPEDNLLDNAGFGADAPGLGCPTAWECITYDPSDAGIFATSDVTSADGDNSALWSGGEEAAVVMRQPLAAEPGQTFQIAASYRGLGLSEAPFAQILFHDADGNEIDWEIFEGESGTVDWSRIEGEPVEAPPETARVQMNLSVNGTEGTVWWDDAALVEVEGDDGGDGGDGDDQPPADFEVIEARGQTINIGNGEVFENILFDMTTGQDVTIDARHSTNWTIRNIGFHGRKQAPGALIGLSDAGGGHSVLENIYMGDGSSRAGGQPSCPNTDCTHGPTGIFIGPEHSGHLDIRNVNVQGWPDNGIYGSAPGSNAGGGRGTIHIDESYGANNYVSTFRLAGGSGNQLTNSVAYNTGDDYSGRPVWIWRPGPVAVTDMNISAGPFGAAIIAGAVGDATRVELQDSQVAGELREDHGSVISTTNVGTNPQLEMPAGVPVDAEEAAGGRAGH